MQHYQRSHEATTQEGTAAVYPNTVQYWYSQSQPEHPPVQQYTHPSHARAPATSSVDRADLTLNSTHQSQIQLPVPDTYPYQDSSLTYVPSQYHTGHITQLPPSHTPIPLPVPPSQLYRDSSTSHVHQAVHPQPIQRPLNPASPHVASYTPIPLPVPPSQLYRDSSTSHMHQAVHPQPIRQPLNPASPHVASYAGQPQVTQHVHMPTICMYGQSPTQLVPLSVATAQPVPVSMPHPRQGRSAAHYYPHSHAVQPGLAPPSLHTHASTVQHFWPVHHPATQTHQPFDFRPYVTHSLFPTEGSYHVHIGELEDSSAAKRLRCTRSDYVNTCTTRQVNHSTSSSLSPAMARYARYLRACYTRSSLPENNKFPPTPSKHYINLAYISRRTVSKHESEKFKVAMVRGEIDEIARDKGLDFCHVAKRLPNGSYPQVVLVEGAPGVGKTTFAWEFCKKWGKGELKQEYSLVVLLRLRDKRIQEAKCLRDLFYHPDETLPDVIAAELINSLGEGVLILLEGLDELPESQRTESSVFLDLIHGRLLPLATVLITTRPWASEYLHRNCKDKISQHVEILGFTKQQIKNYLQSVCKTDDDPSLLSDIEKYLSCYPQIHAAMYIPLNAAIVVEVYRRSRTGECIIPKTMTQLYTALSQTLLIRYLEDHPVHKKTKWKIHSFCDLPLDVYEHFLQLSELAYISIKNDQKLIFSSEDLPENLETLGFMQSVPELYVNEAFSYSFLHLTLQEFLAALYIARLSPEELLDHFEEYELDRCGDGLFEVVMVFVAGLTKFSGIPSDSVRALFEKPEDSSNDPNARYHVKCDYVVLSDHVRWMFETQDPCKINSILRSGITNEFRGHSDIMPFDFYCLGYCVAHSHCQWRLDFWKTITEEDAEMFTVGGSALHISKQNTSIVSATPDALMCLFDTLPPNFCVDLQEVNGLMMFREDVYFPTVIKRLRLHPSSLKVIIIGWLNATDSHSLIRTLSVLPSVKVLELSSTAVTVGAFRELCDLLASTSHSLKRIKITEDDPEYECFSVTIEGTYQHTSVSADVVATSVDDASSIAAVLRENSNLGFHFTVIGMHNLCGNIDGCQLADALHDTTTVRRLDLSHNPLGVKDVMTLIMNSKMPSLEDVNMCNCSIDSEGICYLTQALCAGNTKVRKLNLSLNPGIVEDAVALAKLIQSLEEVNMTNCSIDSEGVCHLARALCENTKLRVLDLSCNHIGTKGAMAIATLLLNNKPLEEVNMAQCNIDSEGTCHLAKALCENITLSRLDLSHNPIGTKGAVALANTIRNTKSLEKVHMNSCDIDSEGACHLAQALCENTTLRKLDLDNNPIEEGRSAKEGIHKLLEAMTINTTLQQLILPRNSTPYAKKFPKFSEVSSRVSFPSTEDG